ncbi:inositol monophosphatase [Streptacidiphilus sp. N1-12]|uniref:Inositol monophosphatase n=2 Tax=Streptacidiphilus alkalitolerans TaxID=3342712 RepID=A0ABV6XCT6_9ACTN
MDTRLAHEHEFSVRTAEAAGDLVRAALTRRIEVREKGGHGDVVTSLDLASERLIIDSITREFPGSLIISEEAGRIAGDATWTWLIDPIDGTNNLVLDLRVISVGITLCHNGVPVVSVVHDPVSGRTSSAVLGQGAWGTSDPTRVPGPARRKPLLAWIQGYGVDNCDVGARALKATLAHNAHRLLELWAPLTCWTMLARGDIDGIVGYRIGEIDLHAGALIATESGLSVNEFTGVPFVSRLRGGNEDQCILAGTPKIVAGLQRALTFAAQLEDDLATLPVLKMFDI